MSRTLSLLVLLLGVPMARGEEVFVDARVATTAQFFQQAVAVGQPGSITRIAPAFPFTTSAFVRFGNVDLPGAPDSFSGELAAWGSLGSRDGRSADADVTSAWGEYQRHGLRVRIGRQVTLPGAARFVRFDGLTAAVRFGVAEYEVYGGWVALPRWNQPRGVSLLGFVGDAMGDPLLQESQNRVGQFVAGAKVAVQLPLQGRVSLGFHEQHDAFGPAFRVASVDGQLRPAWWLGVGARASLDLQRLAVPEARVWLDITRFAQVPLSIDYSYQSPSLLLPQTSILAAFGGANWHELGAETALRLLPTVKLVGRGAGQLFEGDQLGGRGLLSLRWRPGIDGRWLVMAEAQRVLVPKTGYTQVRAAGQWRALQNVTATLDAAVYFYDAPVAGVTTTMAGTASVEWRPLPGVRLLVSGSASRTPWAAFEAQGLVRVIYELSPSSAGAFL